MREGTTAKRPLRAGVMGHPVAHSRSPRLHGYWLKQYGIEGTYEAFDVPPEELEKALRALPVYGIAGVNLTLPLKEVALGLVDRLDPAAARIGAVNMVTVLDDGKLEGRNTDLFGFMENLETAGWKARDLPATVLGAGGAARAVVLGLLQAGCPEVRIVNRTRDRALKLAADFSGEPGRIVVCGDAEGPAALRDCGTLVNATSLGMTGKPPLLFSLEELPERAWVTDLVYAPLETALIRAARARGNPTVDGLGMLLHQARPAFARWFGRDPDVTDALRRHVLEATS